MATNDMEEPPSNGNEDGRFLSQGMRYGSLVVEFVGMTLLLGYVGHRLDERYGWQSWGLLGGLLLGMGLGLWMMIRQMAKINR